MPDDLDRYPETCSEKELAQLAASLGVPRAPAETLDAFRARVGAAWNDPDAIDRALPTANPAPGFVLGGYKLGDTK